jgi:hypothetical protein
MWMDEWLVIELFSDTVSMANVCSVRNICMDQPKCTKSRWVAERLQKYCLNLVAT